MAWRSSSVGSPERVGQYPEVNAVTFTYELPEIPEAGFETPEAFLSFCSQFREAVTPSVRDVMGAPKEAESWSTDGNRSSRVLFFDASYAPVDGLPVMRWIQMTQPEDGRIGGMRMIGDIPCAGLHFVYDLPFRTYYGHYEPVLRVSRIRIGGCESTERTMSAFGAVAWNDSGIVGWLRQMYLDLDKLFEDVRPEQVRGRKGVSPNGVIGTIGRSVVIDPY